MISTALAIIGAAFVLSLTVGAIWAAIGAGHHRHEPGRTETEVRDILGYGPPLWPRGPTNGRPRRDEEPVA